MRWLSTNPKKYLAVLVACYICILPFEHVTALKNTLLVLGIISLLSVSPVVALRTVPVYPAFVFWLCMAVGSLAFSLHPTLSAEAIGRDVIKSISVYLVCYVAAFRGLSHGVFAPVLLTLGSIYFGLAFFDFTNYGLWQGPHTPPRYDVSVSVLGYCALIYLVFFSRKTTNMVWWRCALGLCWATGVVVGALSGSRSFVLAILLSAVFYLWTVASRTSQSSSLPKLFLSGLGVVMAIAFISQFGSLKPFSYVADRQVLYGNVLDNIFLHPLTGSGFGHETNRQWYIDTFGSSAEWQGLSAATHAHNLFLSYMEQMGVGGGVVVLVLFYYLALPFSKAFKSDDCCLQILANAGFLLLIGTLVSNTFNFYFTRHHLWFFIGSCGLLHAWITRRTATLEPAESRTAIHARCVSRG